VDHEDAAGDLMVHRYLLPLESYSVLDHGESIAVAGWCLSRRCRMILAP